MFSRRLPPPGQLLHPRQEAAGERGEVVARVQHVGPAAFPLLLPHEVRAGREERAQALAVELQDDASDGQHHPDGDQDEVWVRETGGAGGQRMRMAGVVEGGGGNSPMVWKGTSVKAALKLVFRKRLRMLSVM